MEKMERITRKGKWWPMMRFPVGAGSWVAWLGIWVALGAVGCVERVVPSDDDTGDDADTDTGEVPDSQTMDDTTSAETESNISTESETIEPEGSDTGSEGETDSDSETADSDGGMDLLACDTDSVTYGEFHALNGAPLLFTPTDEGAGVSVLLESGDPGELRLQLLKEGDTLWSEPIEPLVPFMCPVPALARWEITGLLPSTTYLYRVIGHPVPGSDRVWWPVDTDTDDAQADSATGSDGALDSDTPVDTTATDTPDTPDTDTTAADAMDTITDSVDTVDAGSTDSDGSDDIPENVLYQGSLVTRRASGETFRFALLTDSHIGTNLDYSNQGSPAVLQTVSGQIARAMPDFMINLGDMLDFHQFGFNTPPPASLITARAYANYRMLLGDAAGHVPHFPVIGNWEGENGDFSEAERQRSVDARKLLMPGPDADTYPEGGSPIGDYYAFTWGDALFMVLNVQSYTPTAHLLSETGGTADDWTLGEVQMAWFMETLKAATSKWRFIFIHHTVGGAAGSLADSNYGRGGGQAATVGEQAIVHQLMRDYGVQIFFYGHDHVFTDMVVDEIHYTLPGSAGAPWMFDEFDTGYSQFWMESGWAWVQVKPETVHVQFVNLEGTAIYDYTLGN